MATSSLRGASADAYAALSDQLGPLAGDEAGRVADDLLNLAATFRAEAGLRRVATDPSVEPAAKATLVRGIFGGKLTDAATDLVADAVGRRWTSNRDLADSLEQLGVQAIVQSAGSDAGRLSDELFSVRSLIDQHADLRGALADPARSADDKAVLLGSILDGKVLASTRRLVTQALDGSHRTVTSALEAYQKMADDAHGESSATVRTAHPLSTADQERLAQALSAQYGRPVHLNVVVDPALIGGLKVEIGDDVIDGTLSNRLDEARRKLAG